MTKVTFSYTGSPQMKISQKVLGDYFFLTHTAYINYQLSHKKTGPFLKVFKSCIF